MHVLLFHSPPTSFRVPSIPPLPLGCASVHTRKKKLSFFNPVVPSTICSCPSPKAIRDGDLVVLLSSQETGQNQMAFDQSYEHARPCARRRLSLSSPCRETRHGQRPPTCSQDGPFPSTPKDGPKRPHGHHSARMFSPNPLKASLPVVAPIHASFFSLTACFRQRPLLRCHPPRCRPPSRVRLLASSDCPLPSHALISP